MKKSILILAIVILTSCSHFYYQVQKTTSDNVKLLNGEYVFENEDVKIYYNLWSNYGDPAFKIFNLTDKNLYLNLEESFFIIDSIAYDYYQNKIKFSSYKSTIEITDSKEAIYTNLLSTYPPTKTKEEISNALSSELGNYYIEKKTIIIPPKAFKIISNFIITTNIYLDSELEINPSKREVKTITYEKEKSPHHFANLISYSFNSNFTESKQIINNFWVIEVTNFPEKMFYPYKYKSTARFNEPEKVSVFYSPDCYYIKYEPL